MKFSHIHENKEKYGGDSYIKKYFYEEERINVIKQLDSGKLCRQLADELGVGKTFTLKGAHSAGIFLCLFLYI